MSFTYDPTTDVGRVRRTIPDKVEVDAFFSDEEIASFLIDENGWRRATALALETIASDSAMVMQVIKVQNITTDGSKVASVLLNRAKLLRDQAVEAESAEEDGSFEIAQMVFDDFSYRERILKTALRD